MTEYRRDPLSGRWVLLAPERHTRPFDPGAEPLDKDASQSAAREQATCPFCPGHESETTPEVLAIRSQPGPANTPGWQVRIVPNKYPAVTPDETSVTGSAPDAAWPQVALPGRGVHDVIIDSPRHVTHVGDLSLSEYTTTCQAYQQRLATLSLVEDWRYAAIFKNVGRAAGASRRHLHSQLIATPLVPVQVAEQREKAARLSAAWGTCPYCRMIEAELASGERVVLATESAVAVCPYASRFPYETWILPRRHAAHFEAAGPAAVAGFASVMWRLLAALETALDRPAYNTMMQQAPWREAAHAGDHWHWVVFPRLANLAGFEWATGFTINTVLPEEAARRLRAALPVIGPGPC